ncbi:MAG: ABC transporter permease [Acidobacteriota bacterium]
MTFLQALVYFFGEASRNLVRSWRVSLLAIGTITVSLFLGGVFLLASTNVRAVVDEWRGESRVVIYLEAGADDDAIGRVRDLVEDAPALDRVEMVSPEQAAERFREAFPSLGDLLEGWGDEPLPTSFEAHLDWAAVDDAAISAWLAPLRVDPAVQMVDDDRDWIDRLRAIVVVLESLAMVLGLALLITAVFTIASVIRLTAYLYHDEIAVMRLVGATEFFIRGPFYVEGFLQGLAGGGLATTLLYSGHRLLLREGDDFLVEVVAGHFLSPGQAVLLVLVGGLAGLVGAVASLRRESLGRTAEAEPWPTEE